MPDNGKRKRRFRFTIRAKLFLLSIAILSVPYIGYEYMRELERYLRTNLEDSLVDAARAIAGPMHDNYQLFPYIQSEPARTLFIHNLDMPIQIDGYTDDWVNYLGWLDAYQVETPGSLSHRDDSLSYSLILGQREQYLYALLQVNDETIIYHQPASEKTINSDYVELLLGDNYQVQDRFYFSPSAPGRFNPFQVEVISQDWEEQEYIRYATNITAEWQPSGKGYNLEMAIPLYMIRERLGFVVGDSDDKSGEIRVTAGTAGPDTETRPGRLLRPSQQIISLIQRLDNTPGRRIWVLDSEGQVLANSGGLKRNISTHPLNIFYKLLLPSVTERFHDDLAGASRLHGEEVQGALEGHTGSRWRTSPDGKAVIVSAAAPVWIGDHVRGAVVVEETTNNIQMLQRNALVSLVNKTLLVFLVITLLLLIFATRLSVRLRRLSAEAEKAIDDHGRVKGEITMSNAGDEIGDLSRNYAGMLERLRQYNLYLESLAGRLSHELRTPMAVVQSSLENLRADLSGGDSLYLDRAQEGLERLNLLVTRLSEAARLEQALQSATTEPLKLGRLLEQAVEGYRQAYPSTLFDLHLPKDDITLSLSPDLFMQMLDKIVANAVDFNTGDKPVQISMEEIAAAVKVDVMNYGSRLPAEMEEQLFNSMVSVRDNRKRGEPHLGLGLYIARLIAEFHGGTIHARNSNGGVCFSIILKREPD